MKDNLTAALDLAARGLQVFPLHSPGGGKPCDCRNPQCGALDDTGKIIGSPSKHPWNEHGLSDATSNIEQVTRWWKVFPHANIGVATGPESGIVVLDVDPRHGGDVELHAMIDSNEKFPPLPCYETGSGGVHFWFQHPGFKVRSRGMSGMKGIDVKGDGGYVIVPPSVHYTGGGYVWDMNWGLDTTRPPVPPWLLEMMQRGDTGHSGTARELPGEGETVSRRNETLMSFAGTLRRRGLKESAIFKSLMVMNESWANPLDAGEVGRITSSAMRYEPVADSPLIVDTGKHGVKPTPFTPSPFTVPELMAEILPDVRWAVPGMIPEGLAVLAGKPKLGKSWMAFNIGIAIAQGGIVMGQVPVEEGEVLILALEDNKRRLKSRLAKMLGDEVAPERLYMETRWPRENEGGLAVLDAWLGLHPACRLVVIDTLAKFRPIGGQGKEMGYSDDYAAMTGLQTLAGVHGVAIVLVTHYRKAGGEDWLDNVTGTLGIAGGADTIIGLERPRGGSGQAAAILRVTGRDVEEADFALKWDSMTAQWSILGDADEYQMGLETARLVVILRENGAPLKINDIATRMNKKRPATSNLCIRAAAGGYIINHGGGFYGVSDPPVSDVTGVTVIPF